MFNVINLGSLKNVLIVTNFCTNRVYILSAQHFLTQIWTHIHKGPLFLGKAQYASNDCLFQKVLFHYSKDFYPEVSLSKFFLFGRFLIPKD